MKKLFLSFPLILGLCSCVNASTSDIVQIEIVQMNDIHGHVDLKDGGLAYASNLIEEIRAETKEDNTVLIGNGDMLQETALSRVSYGKVVIDAMSTMKFDMLGVGNHEFDWGFDTFLDYFDQDPSNGEASFPLVNSNIYYKGELLEEKNVTSSLLLEKEDVKIGILSYIGNVYSSISANMTKDYTFQSRSLEIANSVELLGSQLKEAGADVLIVNIHGGNADSCEKYEPNQLLANLKYKDSYLVDAIINGHTHTRQDAKIPRKDGTGLPVVQSSGKLKDFGRIDLSYNKGLKKITGSKISHIETSAAKHYDPHVQSVIQEHYEASKSILEEVYCQNEKSFSKSSEYLHKYAANLMMTATNATAAVCNTGAFRNNVEAGEFNFEQLYALNPFDNHIILCEIQGIDLKRFYDANSKFEFVYTSDYGSAIAVDKTYTLAIIDYVFFSSYFSGYRTEEYKDTQLILRDLMADDLRLRISGFNLYKDYDIIKIEAYDVN